MTTVTNATGQASSNVLELKNLQPGTSYVVQVQAIGSDGNSQTSEWSVGYIFVVPNL
jgi:hypothetical protein